MMGPSNGSPHGMRCPYHPDHPADISVPPELDDDDGWIGWLEGCCGLPAWRCPQGALIPVEARFCTYHGCHRPELVRVVHEVASALGARRAFRPGLVERALELAPAADGASTPCLAGNVLVYLTDSGRLIALDAGGDSTVFLAAQVQAVALRLEGVRVIGALRTDAGVRYLSWDVRDLREALRSNGAARPTPATGTGANLLGLPRDRSRLHQGAGLLRLVVEHDPVEGPLVDVYRATTGVEPGAWLIRRTPNPEGPEIHHPDLRPQVLHQVPVPVPGGILLIGQVRWLGRTASGAVLVPTDGGHHA